MIKQETPIAQAIQSIVDAGTLVGAVTARSAWRASEGMQVDCMGWQNMECKLPMRRNTLFRIAS